MNRAETYQRRRGPYRKTFFIPKRKSYRLQVVVPQMQAVY